MTGSASEFTECAGHYAFCNFSTWEKLGIGPGGGGILSAFLPAVGGFRMMGSARGADKLGVISVTRRCGPGALVILYYLYDFYFFASVFFCAAHDGRHW